MRKTFLLAALLAASLAGCVKDDASTAVICTNFGPITVELFHDEAPITTQNFVDLAESGYYDGVTFHRIITGFMMQGGDPEGTGRGGEAYGGGTIPDEFDPTLRHDRAGLLSMANAGPDTGGSQFFITFAPTPWLDDKHSIFGEVTDGMDIVQEVEARAASQSGTPREDVYMQTVLVDAAASDCPAADGVPEPVEPFACPTGERHEASGVTGDIITPGVLCITNTADETLVWARNHGTGSVQVTWDLTGPNGSDLPSGWSVDFDAAMATIGDQGSDDEAAYTMMQVTVPEGTSGEHALEFHTGQSVTPITAYVDLRHDELTKKGDSVTAGYAGSCTRDGTEFDSGEFPLTLGAGRAIAGFDLGLIGMGESETATIIIPAPLGYGYDGGPCAGDDADLTFEVTINSL